MIAGWFASGLILVVYVAAAIHGREDLDPHSIFLPDYFIAAISIGAAIAFCSSKLLATPDALIVQNPMSQVRIPWDRIERFDDGSKFLIVRAGGHEYTVLGFEAFNAELMAGRPAPRIVKLRQEVEAYAKSHAQSATGAEVVVRGGLPLFPIIPLGLIWIAILIRLWVIG